MNWVLALSVFAVVASVFAVALITKKRTTNTFQNYYTMNRQSNSFLIGATITATNMSVALFIGYANGAWSSGFFPVLLYSAPLGNIILSYFLAPPLRRMNAATAGDYFSMRFHSKRVSAAVGLITMICLLFFMTSQVQGGAVLMQQLLGIPYWVGMVIWLVICFMATYLSGMWSVVVTDAFGYIVFMVAGLCILPTVFHMIGGGWEGMFAATVAVKGAEFWNTMGVTGKAITASLASTFSWTFIVAAGPHVMNRFFSAKNNKVVYKGSVMNIASCAILYNCVLLAWAATSALIPSTANIGDNYAIYAMITIFPVGFAILYLAGAMFAGLTTLNSAMLTASQAFVNDFYRRISKKTMTDEQSMKWTKTGIICVAIIIFFASLKNTLLIAWSSTMAGVVLASGYLPTLIGGLCMKKFSSKAAEATLWVSLPLALLFTMGFMYGGWFQPHPIYFAIVAGFIVMFIFHFIFPASEAEIANAQLCHDLAYPKNRGKEYIVTKKDYAWVIGFGLLVVVWTVWFYSHFIA